MKEYCLAELCQSVSETYRKNASRVVLINTSDVYDGEVLNHSLTDNKDLRGQFKKTFRRNDILFSEIRPANRRMAFVDFSDTEAYIVSTKLMVIRANERLIRPKFLYIFLSSQEILDRLQTLAETRSGTFPQITFSTEIAPLSIMLPSLEEQDRILSYYESLSTKIRVNRAINDNLAA